MTSARIHIDPGRKIGQLDERIYSCPFISGKRPGDSDGDLRRSRSHAAKLNCHADEVSTPLSLRFQLFAAFTEHMGRCIYGGMYEEGSSLSDERGFRKDTLQAMKELKASLRESPFRSKMHLDRDAQWRPDHQVRRSFSYLI